MDWNKLAETLIPDENVKPLDYYETQYPERDLPKGAQVTRLAPSPTGFIHLGNLFVAIANERIAHQSGGLMYLRIEDTDLKRKVDGAVEAVKSALRYFDIRFDEGAEIEGAENAYGPYYQRERAEIYHAYAKELIKRGLAYPCFCTEEELTALREQQTAEKKITGYYGEYAACRNLTEEQIYENIKAGKPYVIRLRSQGNAENKLTFRDEIKGDITVTENKVTAITMASGKKFHRYYFRPGTSSMASTLNIDNAAGVNFVQTLLTMLFSRMETTKRVEMSALAVNDLRALVKDANGVFWMLGEEEPVIANAGDGQTGTAKTDANRYSITLEDNNSTFPKEILVGTTDGVNLDSIVD